MEIILQENFPSLGYVGDTVQVKRGYARNFLIPRGIGVEVSSRNAKLLQHKVRQIEAKKAKLKKEAEERALRINGMRIEFTMKSGKDGRPFGAITVKDIEQALLSKQVEIDRKQIKLAEPIRKFGTREVAIKLHSDVQAMITVAVDPEVVKPAPQATEDSAEGRGKRKPKSKPIVPAAESNEE